MNEEKKAKEEAEKKAKEEAEKKAKEEAEKKAKEEAEKKAKEEAEKDDTAKLIAEVKQTYETKLAEQKSLYEDKLKKRDSVINQLVSGASIEKPSETPIADAINASVARRNKF